MASAVGFSLWEALLTFFPFLTTSLSTQSLYLVYFLVFLLLLYPIASICFIMSYLHLALR